ncbi:autophagy-related protein 9-like isoform X1 [Euphorbia lathyris]|uniref:autophagy-related protein 9-like isoform X1 n=1 Tax=Euphorbia lathyris TaxID=212925 RepID=UPI0033134EB1
MKTLEWTLNWCILQSMFDRRDFISNPETLKRRLMVVGLAMLLLSPFLVIFMLVYLFLRHAEQFYNHPSTASYRRWSNLSRWIFREFSEHNIVLDPKGAMSLVVQHTHYMPKRWRAGQRKDRRSDFQNHGNSNYGSPHIPHITCLEELSRQDGEVIFKVFCLAKGRYSME